MSGHDFEKQVRHKLDDLKMKPSAQAWENIEESLRERKRRVAPIFWLPLLLVGLAAGGYIIFNKSGKQKEIVATTVTPKPDAVRKVAAPLSQKTSEKTINSKETFNPTRSVKSKRTFLPKRTNQYDPFVTISSNKTTNTVSHTLAAEKLLNNIPNDKIANRDLPLLNSKLTAKPSLLTFPEAPSKKPDLKKKQSKWSYGLIGSAGISSVSEGNFFDLNINKSQVEDVALTAAFAPQPHRPSSISPGFTYSLGAFAKRDLSKRFSLSVGLNYLQLNTHNKVGSRINARQVVNSGTRGYRIVTDFFRLEQDQPSEYRNRYHFLEMPVELHTRLNRSEKFPLHLNTGVAVSRLLKSNSLHFDGSTGVYYKNDNLLNRTQLSAKAGFSVGLFNKTTRPIWVGPFARYNVSKILQKDVSASKSFASFGVDVKLFIK